MTTGTLRDSVRDANKYYNLLFALSGITEEIQKEVYPDIDKVLDRILKFFAEGLNSQYAFAAVKTAQEDGGSFELTKVYPNHALHGHRFESPLCDALLDDGKPKVIDPLGKAEAGVIPGLDVFGAKEAVLVRMSAPDRPRIIGVCNKRDPAQGPFLASDGRALNQMVELLAIGVRIGEERRRELEKVQRAASDISTHLTLDDLLPRLPPTIAGIFGAPAACLMLWDEDRANLRVREVFGLLETFRQQHFIPRDDVEVQVDLWDSAQPIQVADIDSEFFGDTGQPALQTVLVVPLRASSELNGILNIYSPTPFTPYQIELAQTFANQAAITMQNAEAYQALRDQVERLSVLLEASQRVTTIQPVQEDLQTLIGDLMEPRYFDIATLYPYDPYLREFDTPITTVAKEGIRFEPSRPEPGTGIWRLMRDGPDSYVAITPRNDRYIDPPPDDVRHSAFIRLKAASETVGLLLIHKCSDEPFTEMEMDFARQQADRAAQVIYSTLILQSIVDSLHKAMQFDIVTLYPYDARQEELGRPVVAGSLNLRRLGTVGPHSPAWRAIEGPPSYFVDDVSQDDMLAGPFTRRERVKSSGYVRLEVDGRPVGILFVNWRNKHTWTEFEMHAVKLFASQAAIAIKNGHLYEAAQSQAQRWFALYEAGQSIVRAGLDTEAVLQAILEQAVEVTGAYFGTLQLLVDNAYLEFVAVWPPEQLEKLQRTVHRMPVNGPGITARAVRDNEAQLVPDIQRDPAFRPFMDQTRSELAVVLRKPQTHEVIGVLNVEHKKVEGLDYNDRRLLIALANLATITLQNAEKAQELRNANMVAIMGAWGADIVHDINNEVGSIRRAIYRLRKIDDLPDEVRTLIDKINEGAEHLALPMVPEKVPEFGPVLELTASPLDRIIEDEISRLRRSYTVALVTDLDCYGTKVAMHEQWLRRLLRHLVSNGERAILEVKPTGFVTIRTRVNKDAMAEIFVEDNGKGVRPEIIQQLFRRPISHIGKRAEHREGRGLLLVNYIVEQHGGQVRLVSDETWNEGACFSFTIPLVTGSKTGETI